MKPEDRTRFIKFYSNLPLNERREIILVLPNNGGPITWEVAYREISSETDLSVEILKKLIHLDFIPSK